jgi:hypothetical protein
VGRRAAYSIDFDGRDYSHDLGGLAEALARAAGVVR